MVDVSRAVIIASVMKSSLPLGLLVVVLWFYEDPALISTIHWEDNVVLYISFSNYELT